MTRAAILLCLLLAAPLGAADVRFSRDVRPILADACFACHGPDAKKRKADFRLDTEAGAFAALTSGDKAFVPGKLADSEAFQRLHEKDRKRMPPASARQLTRAEIDTIRRWIEQGAKWQTHWAFVAPKRPSVPISVDSRTPIDAFLLDRLRREKLSFSPEADRATLLRRVTLDLTGLPPTVAEADAFLADAAPDAYERAVDRLLASPRLGERLAIRWIDAARYADTSGYQNDGERIMWRWRDQLIESLNQNQPFDQFTVEQLAGDLLPGATLEQVIASGFNRNHRGNAEGGIIPAEYAAEYVADRVETTSTVWLGLTMGCARCHDHKYDPLTTKEFYRLFALFNNVPERGKAVKFGNSPPLVLSPTRWQKEELAEIDGRIRLARKGVGLVLPEILDMQKRWEKEFSDKGRVELSDEEKINPFVNQSALQRKRICTEKTIVPFSADDLYLEQPLDVGRFGYLARFTLSAWVNSKKPNGVLFAKATHVPDGEGYSVRLHEGRLQVNLVKRWLDDAIRVETKDKFPLDTWKHVLVRYDGTRWAKGVRVFVDGKQVELRVLIDDLNQTFATKEAFRFGNADGPDNTFFGKMRDIRIFSRDLTEEEVSEVATPEDEPEIVAIHPDKRTPGQVRKLHRQYVTHRASQRVRDAYWLVNRLEQRRRELLDTIPTTMVMQELPKPRDTHILLRGQYDKPGEKVTPGVPSVLSPWPEGQKLDRLGLAKWLVAEDNPLTARVTVNRVWQMLFGVGLVKTAEDFGVQGEPPSHPELLDWLAVEFRESGWDTKRLLRLLVTSRAYRQSSRLTPGLARLDPDNRLLARAPRLRLSAEMIRDQALSASGLLVERLGGPSVKPYQPGGLWEEIADTPYVRDKGLDLYRRGLYTYWKRTVAPPSAVTFDAQGREACSVLESRTNTPLQALNLLNDVTYVEASRVLAARVMHATKTPEDRVTLTFRLVLARTPTVDERRLLRSAFDRHLARYRRDPAAAKKLLAIGESKRDERLDLSEHAAYTALASVILNLDEAITRE